MGKVITMVLVWLGFVFVILQIVRSYVPLSSTTRSTNTILWSSTQPKMGPRKELFFEIVESGLSDRFEENDISKVMKFCQYAKNMLPAPKPQGYMHDPIEEFMDALTAKAWWEPSQFEWVKGLEEQSPIIKAELESVLKAQEVFIGDSPAQQLMGAG